MAGFGAGNSTIVRTFKGLELLAPALGARWAEQLWFSVPAGRRVNRSAPAPDRHFTHDTPVGQIAGDSWGDGPVVYLLHGWGGQRTDLDALVVPLVAAGHRVVALDAPGHGDSGAGPDGPNRSTIPQFAAALAAVAAAEGPAHAVVAHSLGSTGATFAVAEGLAAERLVFFAPMNDPAEYTHEFARRVGFGERIRRRLVARIERRFAQPMSHFSIVGRASQLASHPPLLLIHDRDDTEAPWSGSVAIAAAWPGASVHTTADLGHRRVLRDPDTVSRAVTFITEGVPADSAFS